MAITTTPETAAQSPPTPEGAIVRAVDVVKTYDTGRISVNALRDVDLDIKRGEMLAIMGPSGCGKTTLLNCLSGLDSIDGGDILIEGVSIKSLSDRQRTRYRARRMGFVFQFYNLLGVLTAAENVEMPLLLAGAPARQARAKAMELLRVVGLEERAEHTPEELSGGERQRVTIARALVNDPAIVTSPPVASSSVPAIVSSVLFPEPLGPMIATSSPGATARSMSTRASTRVGPSPYDLETFERTSKWFIAVLRSCVELSA